MMNMRIKKVLSKLEDNGYDAYVVGGYVRDYLLGIESFDVDVSTSAKPKEIKEIFELSGGCDDTYGRICLKDNLYNYDITTFRRDIKYLGRKPINYDFIESKEEDVLRRDFTINGIYMDSNGKIIDLVDGIKDLNSKTIRVIGDVKTRLTEDPLRILRAIRFATSLDFKLEEKLYAFIKQNKHLLHTLSYDRKRSELDLIFKSKNFLKGLDLIKKLNLCDELEIHYDNVVYCSNYLGVWAQIDYSSNYNIQKSEKKIINSIKRIISASVIDNITLFECGLYPSIIAGEILGVSKSYISDMYKNLPIYSIKDIAITGEDIINILNIEPSKKVNDILIDIELNILNNLLENKFDVLKKYILENWREENE